VELNLSEDQQLLQRTFRSFFADRVPAEKLHLRLAGDAGGFDEGLWKELVDLGVDCLAVPESDGGGGGSLLDAILVAMEAGRALATVPLAETMAARRAVARGGWDPGEERSGRPWAIALDPHIGVEGQHPSGTSGWMTSGAIAELVLVCVGERELGVARLETITPTANLAGLPAGSLSVTGASPLARWDAGALGHDQVRAESRLFLAAGLVGCGRRALDLAVGYVTERRQFGQPIGSFQAVQHRLADCLIALDAAELLLLRAASYESDPGELAWRAAVAAAQAAEAAEAASISALQLHGGYGFTLECDAHLFVRHAKALSVVLRDRGRLLDDVLEGPRRTARPSLGDAPATEVGFRRGPAEERFAAEVRQFLGAHLTSEAHERIRRNGEGHDAEFFKAMAGKGWVLASLPSDDGGGGLDPGRTAVLWESLYYADAPIGAQQLTEIVASVVAQVGTAEQRELILAPALAGEVVCAIGYTEPDAGSDVASVTTSARRVDGGYCVNGSKMFTTMAQVADYVFLLVRTDPTLPKHRGLTTLLVPLRHEGVEIRCVPTLAGEQTNATFYRDVFVPEVMRVGAENEGWAVLNRGLAVERASLGGFVGRLRRLYDDLMKALEEAPDGGVVNRVELAQARVDIEAAAVLCDRVYCRPAAADKLDVEAAMAKIAATESLKELAQRSLDLCGPESLISEGQPGAVADGRFEQLFRHAQVATIYAGTSEVLRNLIAQRGLNLPRGGR
jgi:alkylation response protein AidB-like acyl-CoA dehydrogenase